LRSNIITDDNIASLQIFLHQYTQTLLVDYNAINTYNYWLPCVNLPQFSQ